MRVVVAGIRGCEALTLVYSMIAGGWFFSSDFPMRKANADPIELYRPDLDDLDDDLQASS